MDLTSMDGRRYSTKDYVYLELKKHIVEGGLKPSQQINEKEVSDQLGVSRTPVREALQRLELEELIIRLPNGRVKVAPVSVEEAKDIFAVRSLLEGLVIRSATEHASVQDINELNLLTEFLRQSAANNQNDEVIFYGDKIHHYIYQISKNKTAVRILNNMNDTIMRYRRLGPKTSKTRSLDAAHEHSQLVEAIANKDADKAEQLMRVHITNSLGAAIESIQTFVNEE